MAYKICQTCQEEEPRKGGDSRAIIVQVILYTQVFQKQPVRIKSNWPLQQTMTNSMAIENENLQITSVCNLSQRNSPKGAPNVPGSLKPFYKQCNNCKQPHDHNAPTRRALQLHNNCIATCIELGQHCGILMFSVNFSHRKFSLHTLLVQGHDKDDLIRLTRIIGSSQKPEEGSQCFYLWCNFTQIYLFSCKSVPLTCLCVNSVYMHIFFYIEI